MHQEYGAWCLSPRATIRRVTPLTRQVLEEAGIGMADVGAVAYGRPGSGRGAAGGRQRGAGAGLVAPPAGHRHPPSGRPSAVAHAGRPRPEFPFVALLVSGGHTQLMRVDGVGRYELLGETLDDAAGEAFDKSAKLMGLGYPGGPALSKLAGSGDATRFELPRPMLHSGDLDFSFSGLKTAVLTRVKAPSRPAGWTSRRAPIWRRPPRPRSSRYWPPSPSARSSRPACAGWWWRGVGANQLLRAKLDAALKPLKARAYFPPLHLCTDNGAMIAFAAAERVKAGWRCWIRTRTASP